MVVVPIASFRDLCIEIRKANNLRDIDLSHFQICKPNGALVDLDLLLGNELGKTRDKPLLVKMPEKLALEHAEVLQIEPPPIELYTKKPTSFFWEVARVSGSRLRRRYQKLNENECF